MILSTLSINFGGLALGFPKHLIRDEFFMNPRSFSKLANVGLPLQQSSIILPSNKVHYRASPKAYGAIEQPPLNLDSFSRVLEQSTPFVRHLSHFWLHLWDSQFICLTFDDSIDMTKLRAWIWYHVRNHRSPRWYDIVHFENELSWLCFGLPQKDLVPMDMYSLLMNSGSFSKLATSKYIKINKGSKKDNTNMRGGIF